MKTKYKNQNGKNKIKNNLKIKKKFGLNKKNFYFFNFFFSCIQ